jgi:hypothetical protein
MFDTRHGMRRWENINRIDFLGRDQNRLHHSDIFYFCSEKFETIIDSLLAGNICNCISENTKHTLFKVECSSRSNWSHTSLSMSSFMTYFSPTRNEHNTSDIFFFITDTINTAHRGNNDNIFSGEESFGRSMS